MRNVRIEVPDSIFLSRWWEVLVRILCFLLGMTYNSLFDQVLSRDTYIGVPLIVIVLAIIMGRHIALKRKDELEKQRAIAEIVELERASRQPAFGKKG